MARIAVDAIEGALERLGFEEAVALAPGVEAIEIGDVTVVGTPSLVPFPEMGLLVLADGQAVWNTVDTLIGPNVVEFVRASLPIPYLS